MSALDYPHCIKEVEKLREQGDFNLYVTGELYITGNDFGPYARCTIDTYHSFDWEEYNKLKEANAQDKV